MILSRCGSCSERPRDRASTARELLRLARRRRGGGGAARRRPRRPGFLRPHPRWRFVFVNHATTNPFFVPTRYGIEDACALFGRAAPLDGLDAQQRGGDARGDAPGDPRAGRRHRGLRDRPAGVQRSDRAGAPARHPGRLVQRGRRPRQPAALVRRPGPLPVGPEVRLARGGARRRGRRLPVHRHARAAEHPAAHRRRARRDPRLRQADPDEGRRHRARTSAARRLGSTRPTASTGSCAGCSRSTAARRRASRR